MLSYRSCGRIKVWGHNHTIKDLNELEVEITEKKYLSTRGDKNKSLERRDLVALLGKAGIKAVWATKPWYCSPFPTSDCLWWKGFFFILETCSVCMSSRSSYLSGENRFPAPLHTQQCTHHRPDWHADCVHVVPQLWLLCWPISYFCLWLPRGSLREVATLRLLHHSRAPATYHHRPARRRRRGTWQQRLWPCDWCQRILKQ